MCMHEHVRTCADTVPCSKRVILGYLTPEPAHTHRVVKRTLRRISHHGFEMSVQFQEDA